jgi:NADPH-dependent 2,4-dienoyl-CoA reductase/sulfur reductase-like enzyme/nitrite reductase/ring-hydroxylating ferredoxin subunit
MNQHKSESAPDLTRGIALTEFPESGMLAGTVGEDEVLVVKRGEECFAIGAHCTHYKGPLIDGLVVGDTVRCPWHHACFSLRTGESLRPPALEPASRWRVERTGDRITIREKLPEFQPRQSTATDKHTWPESVVIVGGGAAGLAAADVLRREGYDRPITMFSADAAAPTDRPNLSKDYLAGTAPEDWMPLKGDDFYRDHRIDLILNTRVIAIDVDHKRLRLSDGRDHPYGGLLLATGAEPVRLNVPGADLKHVHYLRSFADSKQLVGALATAKRAVVVGASFIGLEVAASLRARGLEVHVVAPENVPMERVLGVDAGQFVRRLHEAHGVVFHLGLTVARIDNSQVTLSDGTTQAADLVVIGVGVKPRIDLAEQANLTLDRGVLVNEYLETSAPGVFAAGDIARWPDPHSMARIRVEHWVVAERQGQTAARNLLGRRERFDAVPFFWSQHYDITINYVGHAEAWDAADVDGVFDEHDCTVTYRRGGKTLAVATIFRDRESLQAEWQMEQGQIG